jgi:hypothetical protein
MGGTAAPKDRPANITAAKAVRKCAQPELLPNMVLLLVKWAADRAATGGQCRAIVESSVVISV